MLQIRADNPEVTNILNKICAIVRDNGGDIHPDLIITCKQNNISVHIEHNNDQTITDFAFKIPHDLLIAYDDFVLSADNADNNVLAIESHIDNIAPLHLELMRLMLALYNTTDKLNSHKNASPWYIYKDSDILNSLTQSRTGSDMDLIQSMARQQDYDDLALLTFFKSRLLKCHINKNDAHPEGVLMPLVDLLNHHNAAKPYKNFYTPQGGILAVDVSRPEQTDQNKSPECFVNYGVFDCLDTYLHYGFVNNDPAFVRSVPLTIDLKEYGTLNIKALNVHVAPGDLPAGFQDLSFYMPIINVDAEKNAVLSHIIIPSQTAPKSMRRILSLAIDMMNPGLDRKILQNLMLESERFIVNFNISFYNDHLRVNPDQTTENDSLSAVQRHQSTLLGLYKDRTS